MLVNMNMKKSLGTSDTPDTQYAYAGIPLTAQVATALIDEVFSASANAMGVMTLREFAKAVSELHYQGGGLPQPHKALALSRAKSLLQRKRSEWGSRQVKSPGQ